MVPLLKFKLYFYDGLYAASCCGPEIAMQAIEHETIILSTNIPAF